MSIAGNNKHLRDTETRACHHAGNGCWEGFTLEVAIEIGLKMSMSTEVQRGLGEAHRS